MSDFKKLYKKYSKRADRNNSIAELALKYIKQHETSMIDAASTALSINAVFLADKIDYSAINPQMEESFKLAFPNKDISELSEYNADQLGGIVNSWKGKYFEVIVRDKLNTGESVGEIILKDGQTAVLADSPTQPGWDLNILNSDGTTDELLQLKSTESIAYVKTALEKYPDISVVTTNEVPSEISDQIFSSDISDQEIEAMITDPISNLFDSELTNVVEAVLPGLPFVIIAGREGRHYFIGKKNFDIAIGDGLKNLAKHGISWGAGALAFFVTDLGLISIPTAIITRIGIDKFERKIEIIELLEKNKSDLGSIVDIFI